MATPADTVSTYDAIGNREDLIDNIYNIAPTTTTPLKAFAPDINGVCKTAGMFLITSTPTKIERIIM
jgi:hypothetical protein